MVEPNARIRLYEPADNKQVRFALAKANMEPLAVANRRAYVHPLTISAWIAISCIFIEFMHWWPNTDHGLWGYLSPVPAFGSTAVPIMFLIDWLNRPFFEERTQSVLRAPDIQNIESYYSRSKASGFWILEYGDSFVGLLGLDASPLEDGAPRSKTPSPPIIRHFYVEQQYRGIKIQNDLLAHAVNHAFHSNPKIRTITAPDSPLVSHTRASFRHAGFVLEKNLETIGVYGWKLGMRTLQRDAWNKAVEE
ncbi:hypothetical protein PLICRDRAFT_101986 [Plicaturopsis crispa FD-325 SS-3]|nr:hypothetical protein PLICRDRAFT_101986 [Plicaturopsis crispa FD-325 SS-3]